MKAGRELDALVAEKVMGWKLEPYTRCIQVLPVEAGRPPEGADTSKLKPFNNIGSYEIPHYSTAIAAAWEVVEKLRLAILPMSNGQWGAAVNEDKEFVPGFIANTAQHAICLAALKAVTKWNG